MLYYQRYQAGEHQEVWTELRALGPDVMHKAILEDVRPVVCATADRLLSNLRRIAESLKKLGFEFVAVSPAIPDAGSILGNVQASMAETLLSDPSLSREQAEQYIKSIPQLLGGLSGASFAATPTEPNVMARSSPFGDAKQSRREVAAYEKVVGPVPLILRELWFSFGWVDFTCRTKDGTPLIPFTPLAMLPPIGLLDAQIEWKYDNGEEPFQADLLQPADLEELPLTVEMAPGVDARLETGEWLLDYLRRVTRNGGFEDEAVLSSFPKLREIAEAWQPF